MQLLLPVDNINKISSVDILCINANSACHTSVVS